MNSFQKALAVLLRHEGGYVNDPDDAGGPTNFGITQRSWDAYRASRTGLSEDVKDLTLTEVGAFYYDTYWLTLGLGDVADAVVATVLLDQAVLAGEHSAVTALQKTLGVESDGNMGAMTVLAINREANIDAEGVAFRFVRSMAHHYIEVAKARPVDLKFLSGWIDRLFSLADYIGFGETL